MSNIKSDIKLFNKLADFFLQEEKDQPVAKKINPKNLISKIDLRLSESCIDYKALVKILKKLILNTPKTSSKLFLISFLEEDNPKLS